MSSSINDSILNTNFGGGASGSHLDFDLSPEQVIDAEYEAVVEEPQGKRVARKNLVVLAIAASIALIGGAATQLPQVQHFLGGSDQATAETAFLAGVANGEVPAVGVRQDEAATPSEQTPAGQDNPFAAALPVPAAIPAPALASPAWADGAGQGDDPQAAEAGSGQKAASAGTDADAPMIQDNQSTVPVQQGETALLVPTKSMPVATPAPAPAPAPATVAAVKPAETVEAPKPAPQVKAEKSASEVPQTRKAEVESKKAPVVARAPEPRQGPKVVQRAEQPRTERRTNRDEQVVEDEKIRSVMNVTAAQIGLRELTTERIVVKVSGTDLQFRVSDVLPSGERIEKIDPVAMAVITDRSVIRVRQ